MPAIRCRRDNSAHCGRLGSFGNPDSALQSKKQCTKYFCDIDLEVDKTGRCSLRWRPANDYRKVFIGWRVSGLLLGTCCLRMLVEQQEQGTAQKWTSCEQAGDERIFLIATQRRVIEFEGPASSTFN